MQPLSSWKQIFLSITSEIKGTAHTVLGSAHSRAGGKGSLWDLTQDKHTLSHSQGLTRGPCALGWLRRTWGSPLFQALSGNIPVRIQVFSSGRAKGLQCSPSHSLREKNQIESIEFNILNHLAPIYTVPSAYGLVPTVVLQLPHCYSHPPQCIPQQDQSNKP